MKKNWYIKSMENKYLDEAAQLVEEVFSESEGADSGKTVKQLVLEIRRKQFYLPELELIMVDENDTILGYAMFSRFHLGKKYEKAVGMGYKAVLVEGNPRNYNPRGFQTSRDFGIVAGPDLSLPAPECLMVKELVDGALDDMEGVVDYSDYESLT